MADPAPIRRKIFPMIEDTEPEGGCDQRNCGCSDIQPQLDALNASLEKLALIDVKDNITLKNGDKVSWDSLVDTLKANLLNIRYDATDPKTKEPCDQCGTCGDLENALERSLGKNLGQAVAKCCGPQGSGPLCKGGKDKPAFDGLDQDVNPCGEAADNYKGPYDLIPCDIDLGGGDKQVLEFYKYKCEAVPPEAVPPEECKNNVKFRISADLKNPLKIELPIPTDTLDKLTSIVNAIKNFYRAAINIQNLGGKEKSLRDEACLVILLNFMCSNQIAGIDQALVQNANGQWIPPDIACYNAMLNAGIGCKETALKSGGVLKKSPNNFCQQMIQKIGWNHTLTYGHIGDAVEGCPEIFTTDMGTKNPWPNEDDILFPCAESSRVKTVADVFVPTPANPTENNWLAAATDAAKEKLKQISRNFPNKCPEKTVVDGQGNVVTNLRFINEPPLVMKVTSECNGAECACGGDVVFGDNTPNKEQQELLDNLKGQIYTLQLRKGVVEAEKNRAQTELKKLQDLYKDGPAPADVAIQMIALTKTIADLTEKSKAFDESIKNIADQISALQNTGRPLFGRCYQFWYSYCPANSTPATDVTRALPQGEKKRLNPTTRDKENDHSNFYDLLRKIRDASRILGSLCPVDDPTKPNQGPLEGAINSCFGTHSGKDPMGDGGKFGSGVGNDSGPVVHSGDPKNAVPGSSCTENGGVDDIPSGGPCVKKGVTQFYDNDIQRRNCVLSLHNILTRLTEQISASSWKSLWEPAGNPVTTLIAFNNAINNFKTTMSQLSKTSYLAGAACKGWTTQYAIEEIEKVNRAVDNITIAATKLKDVFENFGPDE